MTINIVFPVLNEELRLEKGITAVAEYLISNKLKETIITIVDNGSTDKTEEIANRICRQYSFIKYNKISQKGVGIAFKTAVLENTCDIIGYMDVDLSTDIHYLMDVIRIFSDNPDIKIVNASRLNKDSKVIGRKFFREITSRGLNIILKILFNVKMTDAMCGFKFFRKETIEFLLEQSSNEPGWFLCAEVLIRAERLNISIHELPVIWIDDYNSTVHVFRLIKKYIQQIFKLFWGLNIKNKA